MTAWKLLKGAGEGLTFKFPSGNRRSRDREGLDFERHKNTTPSRGQAFFLKALSKLHH